MKKHYSHFIWSLVLSCFIMGNTVQAQPPMAFKYQAVARDQAGQVMADQDISLKISILQNNPSGSVIYSETHDLATNAFGMINIEVGRGIVVSGDFSILDWIPTVEPAM